MIGEDRLLPRLYREMAQDEINFKKLGNDVQDLEELGAVFSQMTQQSLDMARKSSMASAWNSLKHETINYVLAHSS
ncbi:MULTISPECIES: hypothetical protein [Pseudomonas]|uniref:hypothetical protein n=1 Tax=Pseudomonas TaxID=286 RepID=UPI000CFB57CB|nr:MULTISPECIES: hypothetical protein [Pseudomonas]PQZ86626.1 hypothetical protein CQ048_21680 [Pseudomonas trivialis]PRB23030.1 hypothetical protein CQ041_21510 [Pseudomonas sp. MYb60]